MQVEIVVNPITGQKLTESEQEYYINDQLVSAIAIILLSLLHHYLVQKDIACLVID